ncbi:MAG: PD-(D/E)XK nuclease family protein [Thermoplasmata archaeon]
MPTVPTLSYSSIRTYLECPQRWKYLYIDRLSEAPRGYFSFGRSVHSALEELLRPLVIPSARRISEGEAQRTLDEYRAPGAPAVPGPLMSPEELRRTLDRTWVSDGYNSAEEEARYRRLGEEILLGYRESLVKAPPSPVAIEQHLETRWDGIPVHGYLDRIDRRATGGLEIVDYKTSRGLTKEDATSSDQLSLYQVLVEGNYPDRVEGLTLYHLRSLKPLRSPPRPKDRLEELYDRVGYVSDGVRSASYEPTPGAQCTRCEFRNICPEFKDVPETERERLEGLVEQFAQLRHQEKVLQENLERTAEQLHREADRLGVHRMPGRGHVAVRRKEEAWHFAPEALAAIVDRYGLTEELPNPDPSAVRRLIRNPRVDPEVRRKVAETGARRVRWYWELDPLESH